MKAIALNFAPITLNFVAIALNFTTIALNSAPIAQNFAATALLMPHARGRPLMISTIGGHTATPPTPSPTATALSPPMSGEKAVIVRF